MPVSSATAQPGDDQDYLSAPLVFYKDRIEVAADGTQVMMSWEQPLMQKMAEIACMRRGRVLEVGFGMGISCNAVQALNPKTHVIIEAHPEIYERARAWANGKANTAVIKGRWQDVWSDVVTEHGPFDGISFDVFGGLGQRLAFFEVLPQLLAKAGYATLWLADDRDLAPQLKASLEKNGFRYGMTRVSAIPDSRCTYSQVNEFYLPVISRSASK